MDLAEGDSLEIRGNCFIVKSPVFNDLLETSKLSLIPKWGGLIFSHMRFIQTGSRNPYLSLGLRIIEVILLEKDSILLEKLKRFSSRETSLQFLEFVEGLYQQNDSPQAKLSFLHDKLINMEYLMRDILGSRDILEICSIFDLKIEIYDGRTMTLVETTGRGRKIFSFILMDNNRHILYTKRESFKLVQNFMALSFLSKCKTTASAVSRNEDLKATLNFWKLEKKYNRQHLDLHPESLFLQIRRAKFPFLPIRPVLAAL